MSGIHYGQNGNQKMLIMGIHTEREREREREKERVRERERE